MARYRSRAWPYREGGIDSLLSAGRVTPKPKHGPPLTLGEGLARAAHLTAIGERRPHGTVSIWKLNGRGWKRVRTLPEPIEIKALRKVERGPDELIEFVPTGGRGGPMVVGSPPLLDAWRERPPAR
ncbi:MAG: hypothetical protein OXC08_06565 [Thiotrichales bacterium]|nr:hypothetical protein [Thiotrichales bacterium]